MAPPVEEEEKMETETSEKNPENGDDLEEQPDDMTNTKVSISKIYC